MFHAPVNVGLLDRYRFPYSVVAPGASNGVYSVGRSDGTGPRLFFMRTPRDADGTAYRFEGATLYVQLPERAAVVAALESTGHAWREDAPIVDSNGVQKESLYRATDGSIFLPFELDAPLDALLEERYLPPGGGGPPVRLARRAYYLTRPLLPGSVRLALRRRLRRLQDRAAFPAWPAETSLHRLEALLLGYVEEIAGEPLPWIAPWPAPYDWSLVLTHDVERSKGYAYLDAVRSVEERLHLRSAWYFVPERDYRVDRSVLESLRGSGCEIGLHGLRHDGRDLSPGIFEKRLPAMREYAQRWGAHGFRSPATHRNRTFVQQLGMEHDSSWSDVARYEPQKGGSCSWLPFFIGEVVELPITMPMDHTVFECSARPPTRCGARKRTSFARTAGWRSCSPIPTTCSRRGAYGFTTVPGAVRRRHERLARASARGRRLVARTVPHRTAAFERSVARKWTGSRAGQPPSRSAGRPPGIGRRTRRGESPVVISRLSDAPADASRRLRCGPSPASEDRPVGLLPSTLIIVENDTVPADSRVWSMCLSLRRAGWEITVVSPRGAKRDTSAFERIDGVDIHRFHAAESSGSALGYLREYVLAFARIRRLVRTVSNRKRFDVVQACNPPDFLLLAAIRLRRQGAATIFDQHDLSPELHAGEVREGFRLTAGARPVGATGVFARRRHARHERVVPRRGRSTRPPGSGECLHRPERTRSRAVRAGRAGPGPALGFGAPDRVRRGDEQPGWDRSCGRGPGRPPAAALRLARGLRR